MAKLTGIIFCKCLPLIITHTVVGLGEQRGHKRDCTGTPEYSLLAYRDNGSR